MAESYHIAGNHYTLGTRPVTRRLYPCCMFLLYNSIILSGRVASIRSPPLILITESKAAWYRYSTDKLDNYDSKRNWNLLRSPCGRCVLRNNMSFDTPVRGLEAQYGVDKTGAGNPKAPGLPYLLSQGSRRSGCSISLPLCRVVWKTISIIENHFGNRNTVPCQSSDKSTDYQSPTFSVPWSSKAPITSG